MSPDELYEIMIHLDIKDLQSLCSTSTIYSHLCQNADFWYNKVQHDKLPLFNNPSSINDYIKIKYADDIVKKYTKKQHLVIFLTNEDLSLILPPDIYNQIIHHDYDAVELFTHFYKESNIPSSINYKSLKNGKRIELKMFKMSREEVLNVIFKIAYYYPNVLN